MASNDSDTRPTPAAASAPPLIGVTSYLEQAQTGVWDVPASFLPQVYLDAVTDVGGVAIVLPPQPVTSDIARAIVSRLDGLILSGGADVDPARYRADPHERTGAPRTDRDAFEAALLDAAIEVQLPLLGICRGAQVINVELGGTLIQHLPDLVGDDRYQAGQGVFTEIDVEVDAGSRIGDLLGDDRSARAHLYHHQAIDVLADGLTATSRTADGIIESIEIDAMPFGVAVQWHPEENREDRRLFSGLVAAAARYRSEHAVAAPFPVPPPEPASKEQP